MPSVVDICNRALSKVGQSPIASLDDGNKAARECKIAWPFVRDAVLRSHPWGRAKKRVRLAPLSDAPAFGYEAQYQLPSDCLRVLSLENISIDQPYEIEDRKILIDESDYIDLRYIKREENPEVYDSLLIKLLVATLAFELCEPLTQNNQKWERLKQEVDGWEKQARRINGMENPAHSYEEDDWVSARLV